MGRRRVCQLKAMRRAGLIFLWIVLAFAEMGLDAIDKRLLRTGDHEINLINIRVVEGGGNVAAPRFPLRT